MSISMSYVELPSAGPQGVNPLPYLRDPQWNKSLGDAGLSDKTRRGFTYMTGDRFLPYTMQDEYTRQRHTEKLSAAVLENEHMRATFLADFGGRLYSLYDKDAGRELLFKNPVFQCCNLSIRGAWFSGGVEWNSGQFGHSGLSCAPMFFARGEDEHGGEFLRMWEFERIKRLYQQIDFSLDPDKAILYAHVKLYNRGGEDASLYYWSNSAVEQNRNVRIFSGNDRVIAAAPLAGMYHSFFDDVMPNLKSLNGQDASYPCDSYATTEYFFQNENSYSEAWEAAAYDDGTAYFERSTPEQPCRKMFCWSNRTGGKHWQRFLSNDDAPEYVEVQSGIYPSQVHGGDLTAGASIEFTQAFGSLSTDSTRTHGIEWHEGQGHVYGEIEKKLPARDLCEQDKKLRAQSERPFAELLHSGSGWGALEELRQPGVTPPGLSFPESTLGGEQAEFVYLLKTGRMEPLAGGLPGGFVTGNDWLKLYRAAAKDAPSDRLLLHLALAEWESGHTETAVDALKKAMEHSEDPVLARTLAAMYLKTGEKDGALAASRLSIEQGGAGIHPAFARDHIGLLLSLSMYDAAWEFFVSLSETLRQDERLRQLACKAACEVGQYDFLEEQFAHEFACTREGDTDLCDIWFRTQAKKYMEAHGCGYEEALSTVQKEQKPPRVLDFRMTVSDN